MELNIQQFKGILESAALLLKNSEHELTLIDSSIGDGDHGIAILKVSVIVNSACGKASENRTISGLLNDIGYEIMSTVGGSTSTLWGAFFEGLGEGAEGHETIDADVLKKMLDKAFDNVDRLSGAKEGDKTMMDALIPAVRTAGALNGDIPEILRAAADAGMAGAERSADCVARFGRAKNLKERVIGFRDAGAVSISLLFQGMADAAEGYAVSSRGK